MLCRDLRGGCRRNTLYRTTRAPPAPLTHTQNIPPTGLADRHTRPRLWLWQQRQVVARLVASATPEGARACRVGLLLGNIVCLCRRVASRRPSPLIDPLRRDTTPTDTFYVNCKAEMVVMAVAAGVGKRGLCYFSN